MNAEGRKASHRGGWPILRPFGRAQAAETARTLAATTDFEARTWNWGWHQVCSTCGMRTRRDIEERVFQLAGDTVRCSRRLGATGADRDLVRQFTRAVTSIGAHLEEARAAETRADFVHKVSMARKEAFEAHYWARLLLLDCEDPVLRALRDEVNEIASIVTAIRRNARDGRAARPRAAGRDGLR